ncbi:MAG TPA: hypothetical protein PLE19_14900 [Planctomycetota bacterium]|nr:hypothetical protein [Planctomycetota bacterium]HRR82268.1 hypothetical protein [Planctomycetota bacterium]HRT94224.1 hypothetical protein [Planctomycetota bacterium]
MPQKYRFRFTDDVTDGQIAQRLFLAAVNTENIHGEAQMRLDAKFRFDKATRTVEIDRGSEVGRCLAKLFVNYIAKEFGDGAYSVERVDDPFVPEPVCAAHDGGARPTADAAATAKAE